VLEGSVRKMGNRVRITAQLIEARSDSHLWSQSYDRELENIFAVQEEISVAIVAALKEHLGLQVEVAPRVIAAANTEAHDAYLRGRYLVVQRTAATIEGAVREFEKAISLDPNYALAHAELAMATLLQRLSVYGALHHGEAVARAAPHTKRAMALDPNLAEAHVATAYLLWVQDNPEEALTHFEQAIQLNPNYSMAYYWMAFILSELGRYKEEIAMVATTRRIDPLSRPAINYHNNLLISRNRLDEADRELEKIASIYPAIYADAKGQLAGVGGKWANMVLGSMDALQIDPDGAIYRSYLSGLFALIGLEKEALAISESPMSLVALRILGKPGERVTKAEARLAEDPTGRFSRRDVGMALAAAGDYARARPILEEMWQRSGGRVTRGVFRRTGAAALIAIRRDAGDEAGVGELLAAARDNVRRNREAGFTGTDWMFSLIYEEGLVAYLSGERDRGLALIARGAEDGFFIPLREAYLQVLYDDPGFGPILASQEARQIRERQKFLNVVCTDNPYAAFWQPAERTCERFAAVGEN
jgi:tetratricopeptide (TPR) repeat protein